MENDINKIQIQLADKKEESASNDIIYIPLSPSELSCIIYAMENKNNSGCKECGKGKMSNEKIFENLNLILKKWRDVRNARNNN